MHAHTCTHTSPCTHACTQVHVCTCTPALPVLAVTGCSQTMDFCVTSGEEEPFTGRETQGFRVPRGENGWCPILPEGGDLLETTQHGMGRGGAGSVSAGAGHRTRAECKGLSHPLDMKRMRVWQHVLGYKKTKRDFLRTMASDHGIWCPLQAWGLLRAGGSAVLASLKGRSICTCHMFPTLWGI